MDTKHELRTYKQQFEDIGWWIVWNKKAKM